MERFTHLLLSWSYMFWHLIKTYTIGALCLYLQIIHRVQRPTDIDEHVHSPKVAIVTGGAKGIGFQTSKKLARAGVHVYMGVRDMDEATEAIADIRRDIPDAKVEAIHLELRSFSSIRKFANSFLSKTTQLNILINNAGIMMAPYHITADGWEDHFQVNYLGHYLLTSLLLERLQQSGSPDTYSRIIHVSSHVHYAGDMELAKTANRPTYSSHAAYSQSKLAVVIGMQNLKHHLQASGSHVTVNSVHPGVVDTDLFRHVNCILQACFVPLKFIYKTPEEGALTSVYLALSPTVESMSGLYYDNCQPVKAAEISFDKTYHKKLRSITEDAIKIA